MTRPKTEVDLNKLLEERPTKGLTRRAARGLVADSPRRQVNLCD
jgi:hypothetical protein